MFAVLIALAVLHRALLRGRVFGENLRWLG